MPHRGMARGILIGWHVAVLAAILLLPAHLAFGKPFWALPGASGFLVTGLAVVYVLGAGTHLINSGSTGSSGRWAVVAVAATGAAALFLGLLLLPDRALSRKLLVMVAALVGGGLGAPLVGIRRWRRVAWPAAGATVVLSGLYLAGRSLDGGLGARVGLDAVVGRLAGGTAAGDVPDRRTEVIRTSRHTLQATYLANQLPPSELPKVLGGALAYDSVGDEYLLARGRGELYRMAWRAPGRPDLRPLGLRVPLNSSEFEADVGPEVSREWFRVADLLLARSDESLRVFASHHYWKRAGQCFVVRISGVVLTAGDVAAGEPPAWKTLYESRPCLPLKEGTRGAPFAGLQIGGNMEWLDAETILVAVGDHQFDGWYGHPDLVQDPTAHYGKTMAVHLPTGRAEVFSLGHRNPQGMTVDASHRVWLTEHGPEGGDELNLLRRGGHFGWPRRTYGTDYGSVSWAFDDSVAPLDLVPPAYAWVPSIGVSEVVAVRDTAFRHWAGDLVVASLRGQRLWRMKLEGDRVAFAEPIDVGERIRDMTAAGDGSLVLWTDSESLVRLEPARTVDRGATLFAMSCGGCHETGPDLLNHGIGPNLRGVFDRAVATAEGYDYSEALRGEGGEWSDVRMEAFLADPAAAVPGTTMGFAGMPLAPDREAVIAYLKALR